MSARLQIGLVSHVKDVGAAELRFMAIAVQRQLEKVSRYWQRLSSTQVSWAEPVADAQLLHIFETPDVAGAEGYHDQDPRGRPYARVFTGPVLGSGGSVLDAKDGANTVAAVVSHEVLELFGDPQCQLWAQAPDGVLWALELCDQVENDSYPISVYGKKVPVSNFLCPAAFDPRPESGEVLDFMGSLSKPFTIAAGGYAILQKGGRVSQAWGEGKGLPWKQATKTHPASRTWRRGARA